jgi:hypothetical protein
MQNIQTRTELADYYHVSTKTLNRWLYDAHIDLPSGYITPANLALVFQRLGHPTDRMSDFGRFAPKLPETSR